ncbi:uncharacterized protein [Centruroides vittatus]|uniref:uncharacterized protein n=1 Tax=Centruroides vittatus TaxID=120091 RepID=UPI00350FDAA3
MKKILIILASIAFAFGLESREQDPYYDVRYKDYARDPRDQPLYESGRPYIPTFYQQSRPTVMKRTAKPELDTLKPHHPAIVTSYFNQGYNDGKQTDYKTHYDLSPHYYYPDSTHSVYSKPVVSVVSDYRKERPRIHEFVPFQYYPRPGYIPHTPYVPQPNYREFYNNRNMKPVQENKKRIIYDGPSVKDRNPLSLYGY